MEIRHSSLYCPRDFDISPYFNVVKPTIARGFDYKALHWADPSRIADVVGPPLVPQAPGETEAVPPDPPLCLPVRAAKAIAAFPAAGVPGAAQHEAKRSDALQNRDLLKLRDWDDPGSAMHRCALHRVREMKWYVYVRRRNQRAYPNVLAAAARSAVAVDRARLGADRLCRRACLNV